jgi:hypothetical protein
MEGPTYYWFFTTLMLLASVAFIAVALTYKGKTYLQDSAGPAGEVASGTADDGDEWNPGS